MKQTVEEVTVIALQHFGEGELQINEFGNVFWLKPDGLRIALGYTIFEASGHLIEFYGRREPSVPGEEED
jgi:hypothetical protein